MIALKNKKQLQGKVDKKISEEWWSLQKTESKFREFLQKENCSGFILNFFE